MDLSKLSEIEIKALIYDQLVTIEIAQKNISELNIQLKKFKKEK